MKKLEFEEVPSNGTVGISRARVPGGWLVVATDVRLETVLDRPDYVYESRPLFLPDPEHEWLADDSPQDSPQYRSGTLVQFMMHGDLTEGRVQSAFRSKNTGGWMYRVEHLNSMYDRTQAGIRAVGEEKELA